MAFSTGNQAALKAAQDVIKRGQDIGDQSVVDAGMQAKGKIFADEGVSYSPGSGTGESGSNAGEYDQSAYLKQQAASKLEAELAQLRSAYQKSALGYDAAAEQLPATYQKAKNTAAAQNAQEKRAFDERAAASGLNSGTNAQAQMAMSSVYQAQLAGLDREQAQKQSDIQLEKAKLQSEYQAAIAQARAEGDANLASALYQEMLRVQGLEREDQQIADANARDDALLAKQWERQDKLLAAENAREDAQTAKADADAETEYARQIALAYGLIDPANIGQINSLADLAELSAGTVAAAGGNPTGDGKGYDNGDLTPDKVRQMQDYYGLTADGMWGPNSQKTTGMTAKAAWDEYQAAMRFRASVLALGIGPVNATAVEEIAVHGGLVENADGTVAWAPGWDASNYKQKMADDLADDKIPTPAGLTMGLFNFGR